MQSKQAGLTQQLDAFRASFLSRLPCSERENLAAAEVNNRQVLQGRIIPRAGDTAPVFMLPDQHGTMVRLADRLSQGPVVVLFVRGAWCPFCTLTLRAYQQWLPAIHDAGGDLLAITPQPATTCSLMAERDLLAFETLSDHGNLVARSYGIALEIDPVLRPLYERLGHDLPRINGTGDWTVPMPATFIIGRDGRVVLAHVEPVHYRRLEPAKVVAALEALRVPA
jgi:peroxiredoxin